MTYLLIFILALIQGNQDFYYADQNGYYMGNTLFPGIPYGTSVSWTPDGKHITYFQDSILFIMNVATQQVIYYEPVDVDFPSFAPNWSQDGRSFVIEEVTEPDYTERLRLFTVDEAYHVTSSQLIYDSDAFFPQWSPDGTQLAFVDSFAASSVYIYDVTSNTLTSHPINVLSSFRVYWLDNDHIAYVWEDGIYRLDLTTDTSELLYETGYNPLPARNHWQISPDQTRLIFDGGLYAITNQEIERIGDVDSVTAWSPDGEYFLMVVTHIGATCVEHPTRGGSQCYSTVSLDIVLNDRNGNHISDVAQDVGIVNFAWRPHSM